MKYLAYGSNMLVQRLRARVSSAANPRIVALPGFALRFRKRSIDGSGKCDLVRSGDKDIAYGVVFDVAAGQIGDLDRAEGAGKGYRRASLSLWIDDAEIEANVYLAEDTHIDDSLRPYRWYRDVVIAGAEQHGLPEAYRQALEAVPFDEDPDPGREAQREALKALAEYRESNAARG